MRVIGGLGEMVWAQWDELRHAAAVIGTVLYVCVQPRYWVHTVREAFVRQVVAIGVESVWLVCGVAALFQKAKHYRDMAITLRLAGEAYREAGDTQRAEDRLFRARRSLTAQGEKAE